MFDTLLGQEHVKRILTEAVAAGRVSHAYVFCGPEGIGRKSFASELAESVMCLDPGKTGEACGNCLSCRLFRAGTNPDFKLIVKEPGKASVGIDNIRAMEEDLATAPQYGRKKVFVIDSSESLTEEAQNAMLKTIEEPPEYALVILICSNLTLLIDTVLSRVTRLDFARNTNEEVIKAFSGKVPDGAAIVKNEGGLIAAYADGIIGRGLMFSDFRLFGSLREILADTVELVPEGGSALYINLTTVFLKYPAQKEFMFFEFRALLRDLEIHSRFGGEAEIQNRQFAGRIARLSSRLTHREWREAGDIVDAAWQKTSVNMGYRMIIDTMAAELTEITRNSVPVAY